MGTQLKTEQERLEMDDTSLIEELATLDVGKDTCESCEKCSKLGHMPNEQVSVNHGEVIGGKIFNIGYSTCLLVGETSESAYKRAWDVVKLQLAKKHEEILAKSGSE